MVWRSVVIAGVVVLAAQAPLAQDRPPSDKRPGPPTPFLWGGELIETRTAMNAEDIREKYLPAMATYPTPEACARADGAGEVPPAFTRSDLIALPSLAAKDVCLFYHVQPIDGTEAMVAELERLGFRENYRDDRREGVDLTFVWDRVHGPLIERRGLSKWWYDLRVAGELLKVTIKDSKLYRIELSPHLKIQF